MHFVDFGHCFDRICKYFFPNFPLNQGIFDPYDLAETTSISNDDVFGIDYCQY